MKNVPKSWRRVRLGEICRIKHGFAFSSNAMKESDDKNLPVIVTIGNFRYEGGFRFEATKVKRLCGEIPPGSRLQPGNILLIMTCQTPDGSVLGIPAKIPNDGQIYLHNQRMGLAEILDETSLNADFLFHLCCSSAFRRHLFETSGGTKVLHTSPSKIESFQFTLPPSDEQHRISELLSSCNSGIRSLESLLAAKSERKQGLMRQLLTGQTRFKEFVKSTKKVKTRYGDFPEDWSQVHMGDITDEAGKKNGRSRELPVLSCTKYRGLVNSLEYFGKRIFSEDTSTYRIVERGDFAYATNHIEEGSIGYQNLHDAALISPMYTVFRTKPGVDHGFFWKLIKTELYRHIFEVNTSGSIARRGALRWDEFALIKVFLPTVPEQKRIAAVLNTCDEEIKLLEKQLEALKEQKSGLMQKLLAGEVRVNI
jgi:type I restriction enzyme S subunit